MKASQDWQRGLVQFRQKFGHSPDLTDHHDRIGFMQLLEQTIRDRCTAGIEGRLAARISAGADRIRNVGGRHAA
jgi:hypothetical protein